jgi:hypothetical protein
VVGPGGLEPLTSSVSKKADTEHQQLTGAFKGIQ